MTMFSVFKDASGAWRWVGTYTNSFKDNDTPPDIITSNAHRAAVESFDDGQSPLPPLYIWHEQAWKVGETDMIVADEIGDGMVFLTAVGRIDTDKTEVAELLADRPCTMSHGIYVYAVDDLGSHREITDYKTVEVSVLPAGVALPANPFTYFTTLEDTDMSINPTKRERLLSFLPEALVGAIEGSNKALAEKAVDEDVLHKDADADSLLDNVTAVETAEPETVEPEVAPEPEAAVEPEVEPEPVAEPQALSADDLKALGELFAKGITTLQQSLKALEERLDAAEANAQAAITRLAQAEDTVKALEKESTLPLASGALDRFLEGMVKAAGEVGEKDKSVPPTQAAAHASGANSIFSQIIGGN